MPIPSARPDRDIIFKEMSVKYIKISAVSTLRGMLAATTNVGFTSFRKMASTKIANTAPIIMFFNTLLTIKVI